MPVVEATHEELRPKLYRKFLQAAGVDEPAFYAESATHLVIDFRSIRDSGITWRFLAGERAEVVQREAGHEHISTTLGYAKEVQDRRGRFGEPFPSLPPPLGGPPCPPACPPAVSSRQDAHLDVIESSRRRPLMAGSPVFFASRADSIPVRFRESIVEESHVGETSKSEELPRPERCRDEDAGAGPDERRQTAGPLERQGRSRDELALFDAQHLHLAGV